MKAAEVGQGTWTLRFPGMRSGRRSSGWPKCLHPGAGLDPTLSGSRKPHRDTVGIRSRRSLSPRSSRSQCCRGRTTRSPQKRLDRNRQAGCSPVRAPVARNCRHEAVWRSQLCSQDPGGSTTQLRCDYEYHFVEHEHENAVDLTGIRSGLVHSGKLWPIISSEVDQSRFAAAGSRAYDRTPSVAFSASFTFATPQSSR